MSANRFHGLALPVALLLACVLPAGCRATKTAEKGGGKESAEGREHEEEGEEKERVETISLDTAPEAVRQAFVKMVPGAQVRKVERITDEGSVAYEVEYDDKGAQASVTMAESGRVMETEREVGTGGLPPGMVDAIMKRYPGAKIDEVNRVEARYYEVDLKVGAKKHEVHVLANGDVEEEDED